MTVQEALAQGLSVTGIGLAIVFSVLIILMLVMMAMKKIFYKEPAKAAPAPVKESAPVQTTAAAEVDEGELIAVLTAAVAASLNTSTYNLQIKSYRRVGSTKPAWNRAGVTETINSRY